MALTEEQLEEIALRAWNEVTGEQNARIHPLLFEFASRFLAALPKPEPYAVVNANDDSCWADILPDRNVKVGQVLYTEAAIAQHASDQNPDLRTICIADENTFMKTLADRIVGNANPEEDSRLDVAYAIARHLKLDWPSAYESPIVQPASAPSEQKPVAWARKWHMDGEAPKKIKNENGRMAWPFKFKLHPITETKCLPDDVALFAAPQPDYKAQRDAKRWEMVETLMFLGNVELNQDDDGGYSILLEPAENIMAQHWAGNSPEEVIDAAIASVKGGA